jgi:hypothetical protein
MDNSFSLKFVFFILNFSFFSEVWRFFQNATKESIIDWTQFSENLPPPLFVKEGLFLPLEKGGRDFTKSSLVFGSLGCLFYYGLISKLYCYEGGTVFVEPMRSYRVSRVGDCVSGMSTYFEVNWSSLFLKRILKVVIDP